MFDKLAQIREHGRQTPALAWSFLYFFLLLTAYYLLRPVREAMGSSANAMDVFPLAMVDWFAGHGIALGEYTLQALFTGTFVVMILLQPLYGALVGNLPRRRFLPVIYGHLWRVHPLSAGLLQSVRAENRRPRRFVLHLAGRIQFVHGFGVLEFHGRHLQ